MPYRTSDEPAVSFGSLSFRRGKRSAGGPDRQRKTLRSQSSLSAARTANLKIDVRLVVCSVGDSRSCVAFRTKSRDVFVRLIRRHLIAAGGRTLHARRLCHNSRRGRLLFPLVALFGRKFLLKHMVRGPA